MPKVALKRKIREDQNARCALSGKKLPVATKLFDTDRKKPKASGGIYTKENTRVVIPLVHMKRHGTYKKRDVLLEQIKSAVDDRAQVLKLTIKIGNQMLAYERNTDHLHEDTLIWLKHQHEAVMETLSDRDKNIFKLIKEYSKHDELTAAALGVRGIGEITVAYCLTYLDHSKARHASSFWKYCGYDKASHDRYEKGKTSGGNKKLRTALYNMAQSQIKCRGPYREVYDRTKQRLSVSDKIVKTRNTKGILVEAAWKDTKPCHRDGAAIRQICKHFLADYWYVGRTLLGLPTDPTYAEAILGKNHKTIMPKERGWEY